MTERAPDVLTHTVAAPVTPGDFGAIIDAAGPYDTVVFGDAEFGDLGTQLVDKPLTLRSTNGDHAMDDVVFSGSTRFDIESDDVELLGLEFENGTADVVISIQGDSDNAVVSKSRFVDIDGRAINLNMFNGNQSNIVMDQNIIENTGGHGIEISDHYNVYDDDDPTGLINSYPTGLIDYSVTSVRITDNTFREIGFNGEGPFFDENRDKITDHDATAIMMSPTVNKTIDQKFGKTHTGSPNPPTAKEPLHESRITGNDIDGTLWSGIQILSHDRVVIADNTITNVPKDGIKISYGATSAVRNNTITDTGFAPSVIENGTQVPDVARAAISVANNGVMSLDDNVIHGNVHGVLACYRDLGCEPTVPFSSVHRDTFYDGGLNTLSGFTEFSSMMRNDLEGNSGYDILNAQTPISLGRHVIDAPNNHYGPYGSPANKNEAGLASVYGPVEFAPWHVDPEGTIVADGTDIEAPTVLAAPDLVRYTKVAEGTQLSFELLSDDPTAVTVCHRGEESPVYVPGTHEVICAAVDPDGNADERRFMVTLLHDGEKPEFGIIEPITKTITEGDSLEVHFPIPVATDNIDEFPEVTCNPGSPSTFGLGQTNVTCLAIDDAGNISDEGILSITVELDTVATDNLPPAVTVPMNITKLIDSGSESPVTFETPTAEDPSGIKSFICTTEHDTHLLLDNTTATHTFPLGDTDVTCTAVDNADNAASESFAVTVELGTTGSDGSLFNPVSDITRTYDPADPPATVPYDEPTLADTNSTLAVQCLPPSDGTFSVSGNTDFVDGANQIACNAIEDSGEDLTIHDTVNFVLTMTPEDDAPPGSLFNPVSDQTDTFTPATTMANYTEPTLIDSASTLDIECMPDTPGTFSITDPMADFGPGVNDISCNAVDNTVDPSAIQETVSFTLTMTLEGQAPDSLFNPVMNQTQTFTPATTMVNYTEATLIDPESTLDVECAPPSVNATFSVSDPEADIGPGVNYITCNAIDNTADPSVTQESVYFTLTMTSESGPSPDSLFNPASDQTQTYGPATTHVNYTEPTLIDPSSTLDVECAPPSVNATFSVSDTAADLGSGHNMIACDAVDNSGEDPVIHDTVGFVLTLIPEDGQLPGSLFNPVSDQTQEYTLETTHINYTEPTLIDTESTLDVECAPPSVNSTFSINDNSTDLNSGENLIICDAVDNSDGDNPVTQDTVSFTLTLTFAGDQAPDSLLNPVSNQAETYRLGDSVARYDEPTLISPGPGRSVECTPSSPGLFSIGDPSAPLRPGDNLISCTATDTSFDPVLSETVHFILTLTLDSNITDTSCGISLGSATLSFSNAVPGQISTVVTQEVLNEGTLALTRVDVTAEEWLVPNIEGGFDVLDGFITQYRYAEEPESEFQAFPVGTPNPTVQLTDYLPQEHGGSLAISMRIDATNADPESSLAGATQRISYSARCQ